MALAKLAYLITMSIIHLSFIQEHARLGTYHEFQLLICYGHGFKTTTLLIKRYNFAPRHSPTALWEKVHGKFYLIKLLYKTCTDGDHVLPEACAWPRKITTHVIDEFWSPKLQLLVN